MAGTYNGEGTVIGPGRLWWVEPTYDPPQPKPKRKSKSKSKSEPTLAVTLAEVLIALGISKAMMRSKERGSILKRLVAGGVLLNTGQPNPAHPEVAKIIKGR